MVKPNFFIIGAPKAGTTSLYNWLSDHPRVFMSPVKEPHYFAEDLGDFRDVKNEGAYYRLFAGARRKHAAIGEASSMYLFSESAVAKITEHIPNARFVVLLRNPVDLVYSFHDHLLYLRHETESDFERAWRLQEKRARGAHLPRGIQGPQRLQYSKVGKLGAQLRRVLDHVEDDQVHVTFFEDLQSDPRETYKRVLLFLNLKDDRREDFAPSNRAKRNRFPRVVEFLRKKPGPVETLYQYGLKLLSIDGFGIATKWIERQTQERLRAPLSEPLRKELSRTFISDIELLESLTGRDLSGWKGRSGPLD